MVAEVLALPASITLTDEVNELAPGRRKTQDGGIGDKKHQKVKSDHNLDEVGNTGSSSDPDGIPEVHAKDLDARGPWPAGWSMMRIVLIIVGRCVSGAEKRLKYIIYDGWIWEGPLWRKVKYGGADQHHEHAHFSFRYGSGPAPGNPEQVTTPYGIMAARRAELAPKPPAKPPVEDDDMPSATDVAKAVVHELVVTPKTISDQQRGDLVTRTADASLARLTPVLNELLTLAKGEAAEVPPTVDEIAAAVVGRLNTLPSNADKAKLLVSLLGDDAADVARLIAELAAPQS